MWVTLNLYWTQNIPLQKKFNNNVLQHPWVITLKWLEGSSLEFQESSDPEAKQTRLQDRACPTMCKMSHGTIQWPQTEATGHTYTHKQTHAFSMQAQKTHTHTHYEKTQCGIQTHTTQTHWARWQQMTRKSHSMTDTLYIVISVEKTGMAASALNPDVNIFPAVP